MWYLDWPGLFSCMRFCTMSDYREEFGFIEKNASQAAMHKIVWAQTNGGLLHIVVRVRFDSVVDWVDIDLLIHTGFLMRASLIDTGACLQTENRVSYA